jgi:hypothetical protein
MLGLQIEMLTRLVWFVYGYHNYLISSPCRSVVIIINLNFLQMYHCNKNCYDQIE